jgi:hypothetical protein
MEMKIGPAGGKPMKASGVGVQGCGLELEEGILP